MTKTVLILSCMDSDDFTYPFKAYSEAPSKESLAEDIEHHYGEIEWLIKPKGPQNLKEGTIALADRLFQDLEMYGSASQSLTPYTSYLLNKVGLK